VKSAPQLLSVAFALATAVAVVGSLARPTEAASGPDIFARIDEIRFGGDGGDFVYHDVKNIGDKKSEAVIVQRFCGYLQPSGHIEELLAGAAQVYPALAPQEEAGTPAYHCPMWGGRSPSPRACSSPAAATPTPPTTPPGS
jgi:hypothetical protein